MKIFKVALLTSLAGSQIAKAGEKTILPSFTYEGKNINFSTEVIEVRLKNLESIGFNPHSISNEFLIRHGYVLDQEQILQVSPSEEGKFIDFTILDEISVTVPVDTADGVANKDRPSPD